MDPKALSHLDPKARATYDRIMGVAANSDPAATPVTNPDPLASPTDSAPLTVNGTFGITPNTATADQPLSSVTPPSENGFQSYSQDTPQDASSDPAPAVQDTLSGSSPTDTPIGAFDASSSISTPSSSSFFIDTSPADPTVTPDSSSLPSFNPINPPQDTVSSPSESQSPVTPIAPYDPRQSETPQAIPDASSFAQPLPSPSEVQAAGPHETSALLKVIYIVGAVVFFAIYTIFWIKVFNLPFIF